MIRLLTAVEKRRRVAKYREIYSGIPLILLVFWSVRETADFIHGLWRYALTVLL